MAPSPGTCLRLRLRFFLLTVEGSSIGGSPCSDSASDVDQSELPPVQSDSDGAGGRETKLEGGGGDGNGDDNLETSILSSEGMGVIVGDHIST